jgi:hypothetical protein
MSNPPPDDSWLTAECIENIRTFPHDELMRYAGQYVAYSWDGKRIVMAADDEGELLRRLEAAGHNVSRVIIDYVDTGECSNL